MLPIHILVYSVGLEIISLNFDAELEGHVIRVPTACINRSHYNIETFSSHYLNHNIDSLAHQCLHFDRYFLCNGIQLYNYSSQKEREYQLHVILRGCGEFHATDCI